MFRSIRWRIAIPFLLLILASTAGLGFYFSHFMRDHHMDNLRSQLTNEARLVGDGSQPYFGGQEAELDALTERLGQQIDARITIIALDGTVLGDSEEDPAEMESHADRPEVIEALATGVGVNTRHSATLGYDMMYAATPIELDGTVVGVTRVALPLTDINAALAHINRTIALVAGVATAVVILLSLLIASITTRPIKELTRLSGKIAQGELDQRIEIASGDEIGELARAFNQMSAKLKETLHLMATDRDRMTAIVNNMADGVIMTDTEGRVTLVNPATERMLQISQEEAIGRYLIEVMAEPEADGLLKRCLDTGEPQLGMVERAVAGKQFLWVMATPLEGGSLLIIHDLTELRKLEMMRRDFISNISHELRTPLSSIKVLAETLQEGGIEDAGVASEFLQKIDAEVDKLSQLAVELGELSRIESGEVAFDIKPCPVSQIAHQASDRVRPLAERASLELSLDIPPDIPSVLADRERIEQSLVNLLHNAIKFTPPSGRVGLSAEVHGDKVAISVTDTGIGIPADDLPRIFERFYKADKARAGGGTGLGLAIAKHIVQSHGGDIWVESTEGKGSTFTFTLPIAPF
ncbi:MAG: HAMP domain-containing protein [Chloroflexi bacterium]|nr:HAMP domain-containing protein [Chloroflexota bacterium]